MDRREFITQAGAATLLGTGVLAAPLARAQGGFQEGRHYVRLAQPVPVSAPSGKVEVLEFFSYACPHCAAFEPALEGWAKKLPADVAFRRVPVNFLMAADVFQRTYYALEVMGQVEPMQRKIFNAIHLQRLRLFSIEAMTDFLGQQGLDKARFTELLSSFGVQNKLAQGRQLVERYKIDGVPALGVHGRFYTSPSLAGGDNVPETVSHGRVLQLTDQLIAQVRKG